MLTRRGLISAGLILPACTGLDRLLAFGSSQFWNEKPAAEWSADDVQQLLSHSPWAKKSEAHFRRPDGDGSQQGGEGGGMGGPSGGGGGMGGPGGGGPGGGGGGMGGPPGGGGGGGMGGPPGGGGMGGPGGGPGGGMPSMEATVRWESAAPVVEAQKKQSDPDAKEFYIISVSGLPLFGGPPPGGPNGPAGSGEPAGSNGQDRPERPERPAPSAEQRKAMIESLKQFSALQRKGKDPIVAHRVGEVEGSETPALLFYFPRSGDPITLADKEVTFVTRIGPVQLKVKFAIKDMQYHGQVTL